ncbi:MAG: formate dehydrogenase accessory sulfurtransferase FdhD [Actinobacteria bacterium]|jgi:FdhD protein|nr:formate dehydrogenase accessory sulfurtransferase FdhD [Actinomycetota bacterium]
MPHLKVVRAGIISVGSDGVAGGERRDRLAGEEPLEIRAAGMSQLPVQVAVTMRTPGHDFELAAGFLFSEGLVSAEDVSRVSYCDVGFSPPLHARVPGDGDDPSEFNVVTVRSRSEIDTSTLQRNFFMTSSCGICGKASLDQLEDMCHPVTSHLRVLAETISSLPAALRSAQSVFEVTGGLHAAGIFTADGTAEVVREDVGRHNALDKAIGAKLLAGELPLADRIVAVSGRASYELVQKALAAGAGVMCAISAPSSLAVEAANRFGLTLVGFLRDDGFNIYSHPERIGTAGGTG